MRQLSIADKVGTLLVLGDPDNPVATLIQNTDPNNTVYLGDSTEVTPLNPLKNIPLTPGQSTVVDGTISVYGIAAAGQVVQVNVMPGVTSFFQPTNLSLLGGVGIYNTITAPTQPPTIPLNSLWFSPNGAINQWNGSAWVPISFSGQQIITANTITVAQLAAGIIYAGIVNGTVIQAGSFVGPDFEFTNSGLFLYNGTPAHGNLKISIAGHAGTDGHTNTFTDNIVSYSLAGGAGGYAQVATNATTGLPYLVLFPPGMAHVSAAPQVIGESGNPGAANELPQIVLYSGTATAQGASGAAYVTCTGRSNDASVPGSVSLTADQTHCTPLDGNTYSLGQQISNIGPNTISSTGDTTLKGYNVVAGNYHFRAILRCVAAASGTVQALRVGFTGTATVGGTRTFVKSYTEASGTTLSAGNINGFANYYDTGGIANGTVFDIEVEGFWTFSAAGTFNFVSHVSTSSADESFAIQQFSFCILQPGY